MRHLSMQSNRIELKSSDKVMQPAALIIMNDSLYTLHIINHQKSHAMGRDSTQKY